MHEGAQRKAPSVSAPQPAPSASAFFLARGISSCSPTAGSGPTPLVDHASGAESKDVDVAIAAMWQEIDVTTTLRPAEPEVHFADLRQGNFELAQTGRFGENNPEHYLDVLISDSGDVNYGRFASDTYDALMRRAHAEPLLARRLDLLRDAEVVGLADYPVAPLYSVTIRALVNPRIGGRHANPRNVHGARYLSWHAEPASGTPGAEREPPD